MSTIEITKTVCIYASFTNATTASFMWNPLKSGNDFNAVQFIPDECIIKQISYDSKTAADGNYAVFCDSLGGYCGSFIIPSNVNLDIKVPMRGKTPMGMMNFDVKKVVNGALTAASDLANSLVMILQFNKYMIKPTFAEGSTAAFSEESKRKG